ncbi:MAG: dihydrolipoyl dehydrogenase [Candidatus Bipolaricaulota bacterium]
MDQVQVAVVGAGPAGYVCARRAAQLGLEVTLIEERSLGGVCLNEGCIPTKALYAATGILGKADALGDMGISLSPDVDSSRLRGWVEGVISGLGKGVGKLLSGAGVEVVRGRAWLRGPGELELEGDSRQTLRAQHVVLATGSSPIELPGFPFSEERVWSSSDALLLKEVPEQLVVVGGGVIGLELATVYRRLGSKVTVAEMTDGLLPGAGLSRRGQAFLRRALAAQGIEVRLGAKAARLIGGGIVVQTKDGEAEIPGDVVLVAVGRRPRPEGLGLETVGVEEKGGFVPTDERYRAAEGLYAIGDLRGGWILAHKASHEGLLLAEQLAGGDGGKLGRNPNSGDTVASGLVPDGPAGHVIPQAMFTDPEVALVGRPVDEIAKQGGKVGRFPLGALGRAWAEGESDGHFALGCDEEGKVVGAEIIGPHASDLIAEAALAVQQGLTAEQLAETIHAHPTFPEGLWEAALALLDRPLHQG